MSPGLREARWPPPLGLRRTDAARPVIRAKLTGAVPVHPAAADHLSQVGTWNGDTNRAFGTCGPVAVVNHAAMTWQYLLGLEVTATDEAVFDLYRRSGNPGFDPATGEGDNGVDMTVMLAELVRGGVDLTLSHPYAPAVVTRVKPLCFARVGFPPYEDLHAVTSIFGGCLLGVDLQTAQQDQTEQYLWSYAPSPEWGGHAVMGGAYSSPASRAAGDEVVITWEELVAATAGFMAHQLREVYVLVWAPLWDHPAFVEGVDRAALAADYEALTGRPFPVPAPAPAGDPWAQEWAPGVDGGVQWWCRQNRTRLDLAILKSQLQRAATGAGLPL